MITRGRGRLTSRSPPARVLQAPAPMLSVPSTVDPAETFSRHAQTEHEETRTNERFVLGSLVASLLIGTLASVIQLVAATH